jgi:parallel beta helix pectate lyase-like protein
LRCTFRGDKSSAALSGKVLWAGRVAVLGLVLSFSIGAASPPSVEAHPGDNLQALVDRNPPGTVFNLAAGVYRLQSVVPKDGDTFVGEKGTLLSGAQILTGFAKQDQYWVTSVSVQRQSTYRGECDASHPACLFPEDLFWDNVPQPRAGDMSSVWPGKWFMDYDSGKVYVGSDPEGHQVEISLVPHAFSGSAKSVTIRGLTIEKYAAVAGDGAIQGHSDTGQQGSNWVVQQNTIRFNHGMGIRVSNGMQVLGNIVTDNGQMGLGGGGKGILVDGNEIARNNYAGYKYGWEAGGTKFSFTQGLVVRNNYVHDNNGPGLWTDIENFNTLYDHNRTSANKVAGILHEISHDAVIRNNAVENDGFAEPGKTNPWYGGGIVLTASDNVEVYGNVITNCMNGIVGLQPNRQAAGGKPYLLRHIFVHDNSVTQGNGIAAGIVKSAGFDNSVFTSSGNRFVNNTFHLSNPSARCFAWMNSVLPLAEWQREVQAAQNQP